VDLNQILEEKQPPQGGLATLRSRIQGRQRARKGTRLVWALAIVGLLFATLTAFPVKERVPAYRPWLAQGSASLVSLGLDQPAQSQTAVALATGEVLTPVYADKDVVYFQRIRLNSGVSRTSKAGPAED